MENCFENLQFSISALNFFTKTCWKTHKLNNNNEYDNKEPWVNWVDWYNLNVHTK